MILKLSLSVHEIVSFCPLIHGSPREGRCFVKPLNSCCVVNSGLPLILIHIEEFLFTKRKNK